MNIDATFWVAISFFIFLGGLVYLKVPQKINNSLTNGINEIKKELEEAEKLKEEARNLLDVYESKIAKSQEESKKIIDAAKEESEKAILEKTAKFHQIIEERKKTTEQKIFQMKKNALKDIKNISVKISIKTAENLIKNSIDKNKLENLYAKSLDQTKIALKQTKA
ncbi:MAG TPA: ATPase [Pelagibacteraceae bacterium]|jgi:F-type H+-transporting ATPase subunit b|nr:ATPase [Pelagibacteraceae bacterium]|tara:strand:- start:6330 stop:6827 length:498 start_codon:yes stop_codon:yes gene_type:complete